MDDAVSTEGTNSREIIIEVGQAVAGGAAEAGGAKGTSFTTGWAAASASGRDGNEVAWLLNQGPRKASTAVVVVALITVTGCGALLVSPETAVLLECNCKPCARVAPVSLELLLIVGASSTSRDENMDVPCACPLISAATA